VLAARADARWEAKESYLDAPQRQQRLPGTEVRDRGGYVGEVDDSGKGVDNLVAGVGDVQGESREDRETNREAVNKIEKDKKAQVREQKEREDPWKKARGGPSEQWQPQSWSGGAAAPRRRD